MAKTSYPNVARAAAIGSICGTWAMLEMALLMILADLFDMDEETAAAAFGNLDMQQRLTKTVVAARHFGAPRSIIVQLEGLRASVREELAERRNQAVHGIQLPSDLPAAAKFVMHRWKKERRERDVSTADLHRLEADILKQVGSALNTLADIADWADSKHRAEDSRDNA